MRGSVIANRDYRIATIDDRLYGAFLEHLGRAIYTGIYEPDHKSADANGMRKDVIDLIDPRDTRPLLCEFANMAAPLRTPGQSFFTMRP